MTSEVQHLANLVNSLKSTGPRTEAGKNIARFNARRHGLTGQFYCMSQEDEKAYNLYETGLLQSFRPEGPWEAQIAITIIQDQWRLNRSRATEFNMYGQGHDLHASDTEANSPNVEVAAAAADTWKDDQRAFANIALYETRIHRMIVKNEKRLNELQRERKAAEEAAREEAKLLIRLAHFKAQTPETLGLIPTTAEEPGKVQVKKLGLIPATAEEQGKIQVETLGLIPATAEQSGKIQVNGFVFSTAALTAEINREELLKEAHFHKSTGWSTNQTYPNPHPTMPKAA